MYYCIQQLNFPYVAYEIRFGKNVNLQVFFCIISTKHNIDFFSPETSLHVSPVEYFKNVLSVFFAFVWGGGGRQKISWQEYLNFIFIV